MTKKVLLVLAIVLSFTTSLVFAATNDMISNAGESVKNVVGNVGNGIRNGAEGVKNGVQNMGNSVSNMMNTDNNETAMNNTDNMQNDNDTSMGMMGRTNNGGYTAARTAAVGDTNSENTLTWTWFIIAAATILIVGLVWYYGTQNETRTNRSEH